MADCGVCEDGALFATEAGVTEFCTLCRCWRCRACKRHGTSWRGGPTYCPHTHDVAAEFARRRAASHARAVEWHRRQAEMDTRLIHWTRSTKPIDPARGYVQGHCLKPRGLWLAIPTADGSDSWRDWLLADGHGLDGHDDDLARFARLVVTLDTSRILTVGKPADLRAANNGYFPDWPAVAAAGWAGVSFAGYDRCAGTEIWWSSIDTPSVCVWDLSAVTRIETDTRHPQGDTT